MDIHLIRSGSGFQPATDADSDRCSAYTQGQIIRVKAQLPRNGKHHKKAFALLQLGFEYWEPVGFLTTAEKQLASRIADELYAMSGNNQAVVNWIGDIVARHEKARANACGAAEESFDAYRREITIKAGFYDVVKTPSGVKKEAHSLSFSAMPQEKFSEWYRAAFGVIWNMTLYRVFDHESEAEKAVDELMGYA